MDAALQRADIDALLRLPGFPAPWERRSDPTIPAHADARIEAHLRHSILLSALSHW